MEKIPKYCLLGFIIYQFTLWKILFRLYILKEKRKKGSSVHLPNVILVVTTTPCLAQNRHSINPCGWGENPISYKSGNTAIIYKQEFGLEIVQDQKTK